MHLVDFIPDSTAVLVAAILTTMAISITVKASKQFQTTFDAGSKAYLEYSGNGNE